MGHHLGSKSSIIPLIDRLNKYPIGLVDSDKLREILALLFDEREAFVASRFPLEEATLPELVRLTKIPAEELLPLLDKMADKGLVMDMPYSGETYYLLLPGLIGFFEMTFMKNRSDLPLERLALLMREYLEESQAGEFFGSKTPLTRSLLYEEHIPVTSEVTTYDRAREIIREAGFGAVGMCYCRHKKEHLDETCANGAPVDGICISLGSAARFMARRGFAVEKSVDELLAVLDSARALNLTHITDNIRHKPSFICNCCSCCCELLAGVQMGYHNGVAKTGFRAVIDTERCNGCGLCFKACNVKAIGLPEGVKFEQKSDRYALVANDICLGCGACISACKRGALAMIPAANREQTPSRRKDLYMQILKEKKRLTPFVISGVKKSLRNLLKKKPANTTIPIIGE
ncbi:MAG: 4Fe-4S dicluster domain-containing protein [Deltaproteobacteria bacterium]|nr:4Fe-4S dicluster domain-containing protein [Deltaproteobacteria bacterium]